MQPMGHAQSEDVARGAAAKQPRRLRPAGARLVFGWERTCRGGHAEAQGHGLVVPHAHISAHYLVSHGGLPRFIRARVHQCPGCLAQEDSVAPSRAPCVHIAAGPRTVFLERVAWWEGNVKLKQAVFE